MKNQKIEYEWIGTCFWISENRNYQFDNYLIKIRSHEQIIVTTRHPFQLWKNISDSPWMAIQQFWTPTIIRFAELWHTMYPTKHMTSRQKILRRQELNYEFTLLRNLAWRYLSMAIKIRYVFNKCHLLAYINVPPNRHDLTNSNVSI